MQSNIQQNTMKELLNLINDKKIQQMMCNPDILNSMGQKPDINKLMNCQDLHNVVSDRNLMTQIMNLSKDMGEISSSFDKDINIPNLSSEDKKMNLQEEFLSPDLSSDDKIIKDQNEMSFPDLSNIDKINTDKKEMSFPDLSDIDKINTDNNKMAPEDLESKLSKISLDNNPNFENEKNETNNCIYEEQCQNLINMGFEDRIENLRLLSLHSGDIKKVLKVLL